MFLFGLIFWMCDHGGPTKDIKFFFFLLLLLLPHESTFFPLSRVNLTLPVGFCRRWRRRRSSNFSTCSLSPPPLFIIFTTPSLLSEEDTKGHSLVREERKKNIGSGNLIISRGEGREEGKGERTEVATSLPSLRGRKVFFF